MFLQCSDVEEPEGSAKGCASISNPPQCSHSIVFIMCMRVFLINIYVPLPVPRSDRGTEWDDTATALLSSIGGDLEPPLKWHHVVFCNQMHVE